METIDTQYYEHVKGYSDKAIRLCEYCCQRHFEKIHIEGLPLWWFNPVVLKSYCECPCHDSKGARAHFMTLGAQGYLWQTRERQNRRGRPKPGLYVVARQS